MTTIEFVLGGLVTYLLLEVLRLTIVNEIKKKTTYVLTMSQGNNSRGNE